MLPNLLLLARFLCQVLRATGVLLFLFLGATLCAETEEDAYDLVITGRATKITNALTFTDEQHKLRVQKIIVDQYRNLRDIHAKRDSQTATKDSKVIANYLQQTKLEMFEVHNRFLAQLRAELDCQQLEQVKDALTYGVLNHTYNGYLAQLSELNEDQKRAIRAFLLEARELAMDQGSADEKHSVFRQYKGKINNYLSKAGYKM